MEARTAGLTAASLLTVGFGCITFLPTDVLSGLVLHPETTCEDLATDLRLGELPGVSTPADAGLQFDAFTVTSANGQRIGGWFLPAQFEGQLDAQPAATLLIMHGTDGPAACGLPWAVVACSNHVHAVVFDYQGYGDSGGSPDIATQLDDSEAVLNWILGDDSSARQQVHLLGISLGTGPALGLAALRTKPQIQSVALDGAYDAELMLAAAEATMSPLFPLFGASARLGFAWLFKTRDRLDELTVPVMFLHAENDAITPLWGARAIYELAGSSQKTFWIFGNMTHAQPLFLATGEYASLLVTFWRAPTAEPSSTASAGDAGIRVPDFSSYSN